MLNLNRFEGERGALVALDTRCPFDVASRTHAFVVPEDESKNEVRSMNKSRLSVVSAVVAAFIMSAAVARAEDISGTIVRTLMLSENTRLVGDVTCTVTGGPCIAFGAPNIVLLLNGFTITGPTDPATGCAGTSVGTDIGISTNGQSNIGIRGPGVVQRFRADGILFMASGKGWVQSVTTTTNCMSGIRVNPTSSAISVEGNVSVRNGNAANPCGGI